VLERLEQRATDQERRGEQLAHLGPALGRAQRQQLTGVVPVVERVVDVDALVALQADQPRTGGARQRLGHLRLAHPRLALEQQRLLERGGEEHRRGQRLVGQVALCRERVPDAGDRVESRVRDA
jgi:hypothetical protein